IVTDPDLLVADEPTGDLDAKSAVDILTLLSELNRAFEKTIVMVTHDPRAERWVDTVVRLDKGILVDDGGLGRAIAWLIPPWGGETYGPIPPAPPSHRSPP